MDQEVRPIAASPAITEVVWTRFQNRVARIRAAAVPGWVWVVLLWALMAFPAAAIRGTHHEEGTVIGLARGAVEDGWWLSPHLYGVRFIERPVLLSWIAAAIGKLSGGVTVWSARIPHLLFLLAGGLMVFNLVRSHTRQAPAVFGALCWFACPMMAQKFITAEPDVTLSVLLFAGFFLWWKGVSSGGVSLSRWFSIALVLAAAGLTKGPQPLAYFTLGVGAYLVVRRRWHDLPGFILANAIAALVVASWYWAVMIPGDVERWMWHSRLSDGMTMTQWFRDHLDFVVSIFAAEWLPGSILLIPAIVAIARNTAGRDSDLMLAAVIAFMPDWRRWFCWCWPGGVATRYAMPTNLALAILGGILFERWWFSRPRLIAASGTVVAGVSAYLILLGWVVMPLAPDLFRQSRISAQTIAAVRGIVPGTLYVSRSAADDNVLAYAAAPVREVETEDIGNLKGPVLAILADSELSELMARKPGFRAIPHAVVNRKDHTRIFEIQPNRSAGLIRTQPNAD